MKKCIQKILKMRKKNIQKILAQGKLEENIEILSNFTKVVSTLGKSEQLKGQSRCYKNYTEELKSRIRKIKNYFQSSKGTNGSKDL